MSGLCEFCHELNCVCDKAAKPAIDVKRQLQFFIEGGSVERFHTRPGLRADTDGRHMHGVAVLCALLTGAPEVMPSANLLMEALSHDLGEQAAGDVPAHVKDKLPGFREVLHELERSVRTSFNFDWSLYLTDDERTILELADRMDCLLWCCREIALGNKNSLLVWRRSSAALERVASAGLPVEIALRASNFYEAIKEIHAEAQSPSGPDFQP